MALANQLKYFSIIESLPDTFNPSMEYHSHYYKNFTAIQKPKKNTAQNSNKATTRSQLNSPPPSRSGILPSLCIFCDKHRKKINGQWTLPGKNEKHEMEIAIQNKAIALKDEKLLLKVGNYKFGDGLDFVAQEVQYHHQFKKIYLHQKEENTSGNQSYRRKCNLFILEFVESKVRAGQKPILASFLLEHYKNYYADLGGDTDDLQSYTIQNLCLYIKKTHH